MNIHEFHAKNILNDFGVKIPKGKEAYTIDEALKIAKEIGGNKWVVKAQIHAGGRGKAGGVKILDNIDKLKDAAKELLGKKLVTHQTGPEGRIVKRLYVEESSEIENEFYLSCLVDRETSKIAFISSTEGGMDIEKVASENPKKINTTKVDFKSNIEDDSIMKILKPFNLEKDQII